MRWTHGHNAEAMFDLMRWWSTQVESCAETIMANIDSAGRPNDQLQSFIQGALDTIVDMDRKCFSSFKQSQSAEQLDHVRSHETFLYALSGRLVLEGIVAFVMSDGGVHQLRFVAAEEVNYPRKANDEEQYRLPPALLAALDATLRAAVATRAAGGTVEHALSAAGQAAKRLSHLAAPIIVEAFREYVGDPTLRAPIVGIVTTPAG